MKKTIFVLVGPSGSGKNTLGDVFLENGIPRLISHTSRPMRVGEEEGVSYYYITDKEFSELETIESTGYAGHFYGLSKKEVNEKLANHNIVFAITDQVGVHNLKTIYGDLVKSIFIQVTQEQMEARMRARGDKEEDIQKRLKNSIITNELTFPEADYIINNIDKDQAAMDLKSIISKYK